MCEGGACRRDPRGHGRRSLPPPDTSENRILSLLLSHPAPSGPGKGVRLWRLFRGPPREMAHCPPPPCVPAGTSLRLPQLHQPVYAAGLVIPASEGIAMV